MELGLFLLFYLAWRIIDRGRYQSRETRVTNSTFLSRFTESQLFVVIANFSQRRDVFTFASHLYRKQREEKKQNWRTYPKRK